MGPVVINDLVVRNGDAGILDGGGIQNQGNLTLNRVGIVNNAAGSGAGISTSGASSSLTINGSYFYQNRADPLNLSGRGGALYVGGGTVTLVNTSIGSNSASGPQGAGGGIYVDSGTLNLVNVTIADNFAGGIAGSSGGGGGIFAFSGSTVNVRNTIIGNNTTQGGANDIARSDSGFTYTSLGHNLVENFQSPMGFGATGDILGQDPNIDSLNDNGGNTLTFALIAGSPAINAGDNCVVNASCPSGPNPTVNIDQRGITRPQPQVGTVDIGAFEYLAPTAAGVTVSGRVIDAYGRAISGALVSITGFDGVAVVVRTNTFGYFKFEDVTAGQSVVLSVSAKRYTFDPLFLNIQDNVTDLQLRPR